MPTPSGIPFSRCRDGWTPPASVPPTSWRSSPDGEVIAKESPEGYRRSIYVRQRRSQPLSLLESFDAPLLVPNCLKRPHSTVSSQALQLENSELVRLSARHMAGRVIDAVGEDPSRQIERVYLLALTRPPSAEESAKAQEGPPPVDSGMEAASGSGGPGGAGSQQGRVAGAGILVSHVLNSAEFLYVN